MPRKKKPVPGVDRLREYPFYKIQLYDDKMMVWKDIQKKFMDLEEIEQYAQSNLGQAVRARVMFVEGPGARRVLASLKISEGAK